MRNNLILPLFIICLLNSFCGFSQEITNYWSKKQFLKILEHKKEYWFFTPTDVRITDKNFKLKRVLNNKNGFDFGFIQNVLQTPHGQIYVAVSEGVVIIQKDGLRHIEELKNLNVTSMAYNPKTKDLWVGTAGKGLAVLRAKGNVEYFNQENTNVLQNSIKTVFIDSKQQIWAASTLSGLAMFDGKKWEDLSGKINSVLWINSIAEEENGAMWFGTMMNGAFKFKAGKWENFKKDPNGFNAFIVQEIAIDKNNAKWFATEAGLFSFDDSKWKQVYVDSALLSKHQGHISGIKLTGNKIIGITTKGLVVLGKDEISFPKIEIETDAPFSTTLFKVDNKNNLWMIGGELEIAKFEEGKVVLERPVTDTLCSPCAMVFDSLNNPVVGTNTHGFLTLKNGKWEKYPINVRGSIWSVLQDGNTWWISTDIDFYKYAPDTLMRFKGVKGGLNQSRTFFIVKDKEGSIWIRLADGFYTYKNNKWMAAPFNSNPIFKDNNMSDMKVDNNGVIWLATEKGVIQIVNNEPKLIKVDGFERNSQNVKHIHIDPDNTKWVSLLIGGVYIMDDTNLEKVSFKKVDYIKKGIHKIIAPNSKEKWFIEGNSYIRVKY